MEPNHNDIVLAYLALAFVLIIGVIIVILLHFFY